MGIVGLVNPEDLDVAGATVIILGLFEMQAETDLQTKTEPLGFVLALVSHEFLCRSPVELLQDRLNSRPNFGTHLRGIG